MNARTDTRPAKAADLILKTTAPLGPRTLMSRQRLTASSDVLRDHALILMQAPPGFGKTSLLMQWRREYLAQGAAVAWVSADGRDEPERLIEALVMAVRQATGRPNFGRTLLESSLRPMERATSWLAEVALSAKDLVLFVDEAEQLPGSSADVLVYLMRNAPPNLRIVVAARPEFRQPIEDLVIYGQCKVLGASILRFQLPETISLIAGRFGSRIDATTAARLHELVEGWPLGIQLVLAALSSAEDLRADVALPTRLDDLHDQTVGMLLSNLDPRDAAFLSQVAIVDRLQPELCQAMVAEADAGERLARLAQDTPIFTTTERGGWLRMHELVRDVLGKRFNELPPDVQAQTHARAAQWLAKHNLLEAAARHAVMSGQAEWAYDLLERSLYQDLMIRGRQGAVREWLGRLPTEELDRRPRLLLAGAWALAISGRHAEGAKMVVRLLAKPGIEDSLRCECTMILATAAYFAEDIDHFVELSRSWGENPPMTEPHLLQSHRSAISTSTLLSGEPALARLQAQQSLQQANASRTYAGHWAQCTIGVTYLWEGQATLAERQLKAALFEAEAELGRRDPYTCMVASWLASALWEMDRVTEAATILANRLDVLEHSGSVETLGLAYRTSARIALESGAENHALDVLAGLYAVGLSRELPSACALSLVEQVRVHARRFRAETCRDLAQRLHDLIDASSRDRGPLWQRGMLLQRHLVDAYAAIAAQDWRRALASIAEGDALAQQSKRGLTHIEFLGLRALCLERSGENASSLLRELADLSQPLGLRRVFTDAHPLLADLMRQAGSAAADGNSASSVPIPAPRDAVPRLVATPSSVLTPKEREVLEQLARNFSNKEIALAMQVSEQAIKWHVKNLFAKLDAGTRKQVVQRARILGFLHDPA